MSGSPMVPVPTTCTMFMKLLAQIATKLAVRETELPRGMGARVTPAVSHQPIQGSTTTDPGCTRSACRRLLRRHCWSQSCSRSGEIGSAVLPRVDNVGRHYS